MSLVTHANANVSRAASALGSSPSSPFFAFVIASTRPNPAQSVDDSHRRFEFRKNREISIIRLVRDGAVFKM